jgi:hypothetical protein
MHALGVRVMMGHVMIRLVGFNSSSVEKQQGIAS